MKSNMTPDASAAETPADQQSPAPAGSALGECRNCGARDDYAGGRAISVNHIAFGDSLMEVLVETNDDEFWDIAGSPCCGSTVDFIQENH